MSDYISPLIGADKRTFSRVPCCLVGWYRKISAPGFPMKGPAFRVPGQPDGRSISEILFRCGLPAELEALVLRLDNKLNFIATQLVRKNLQEQFPDALVVREISGSGLLVDRGTLRSDEHIELALALDSSSADLIFAEARTLASDRSEDEHGLMALEFLDIDPSDREAVIRFVFHEERKRLREKNEK